MKLLCGNARFLYPLFRAQREGRQTCLSLKVVKFDHFEIGVEHYLPRSQKLKRRATAYPVFYDVGGAGLAAFSFRHIGYADLIRYWRVEGQIDEVFVAVFRWYGVQYRK